MLLDLFLPRHAAILALSSHPYGTGGAHVALEQPQNTQKPEYVFGSVFGSGAPAQFAAAQSWGDRVMRATIHRHDPHVPPDVF